MNPDKRGILRIAFPDVGLFRYLRRQRTYMQRFTNRMNSLDDTGGRQREREKKLEQLPHRAVIRRGCAQLGGYKEYI